MDIKRDPANPRVLLYIYDENFGKINSLQIHDIIITEEDLPECFKINSPGICVTEAPQEYQLDELDITATNTWNGKSFTTLPEIDEVMLNPQLPDPEHLVFEGMLESWIILILVFTLIILQIFWIIKRYTKNN